MAPKKDDKKGDKKGGDPLEEKYKAEIDALARAKEELEIEYSLLIDKQKQAKAEKALLVEEIEALRGRFDKATVDYADILEIREKSIEEAREQLLALNVRIGEMGEALEGAQGEIDRLRGMNEAQAKKLADAEEVLAEKNRLEEAVRRQHELIEKQAGELRLLKSQIRERDEALDRARATIDELQLKAAGGSALKILFGEVWFTTTVFTRLKGTIATDREYNTLSVMAGGKALVVSGGVSRSNAEAGTETYVLNLDTMSWDKLESARMAPVQSHGTCVLGRTKIMVFGGLAGDSTVSSSTTILNVDSQRWTTPVLIGSGKPCGRYGHAVSSTRDKMYLFGGVSEDGTLLSDFWTFDTDTNQYMEITCYGTVPSARKGAAIVAEADGSKVYLYGGHNGESLLSDVYILDVNRATWSPMSCQGQVPEPREDHVAGLMGPFLVVAGGNNGAKHLPDLYVLDLGRNKWGCIDDGAGNPAMWLKKAAVYSVFYGHRLYTLKPSLHEGLDELSVVDFMLPEEVEQLKAAQRDQIVEIDSLEILDAATTGANWIELAWRPPTKNSERIEKFKLMVAAMSGAVKEVCQGKMTSHRVTGLKPNVEYVFSVKAMYEDDSFLRSEPKAFRTRS